MMTPEENPIKQSPWTALDDSPSRQHRVQSYRTAPHYAPRQQTPRSFTGRPMKQRHTSPEDSPREHTQRTSLKDSPREQPQRTARENSPEDSLREQPQWTAPRYGPRGQPFGDSLSRQLQKTAPDDNPGGKPKRTAPEDGLSEQL